MSENKLFDFNAEEAVLAGHNPVQNPSPVPAPAEHPTLPSAPLRLRWLRDEAPKLDAWLVYPTYQRIAAEVEARRLPGAYVHSSTLVLKSRDKNGKLRPIKVHDISFHLTAILQRQLTEIHDQVRHEQIVATSGRYLTDEQFEVLSDATYKALTSARSLGPSGGRRPAGSSKRRRTSKDTVGVTLADKD